MANTAKRTPRKSAKKTPQIAIVEAAEPTVYTNQDLVRRREAAVPRGVPPRHLSMRPTPRIRSFGMLMESALSTLLAGLVF